MIAELAGLKGLVEPGLSLLLSILGTIGIVVTVFSERCRKAGVKIFGSFLVCGTAFAAQNAFVYTIAVFITATLVTELDFLEKLGALAWGRKEYWEYRLRAASPRQIRQKARREAKELVDDRDDQLPDGPEKLVNPIAFESSVLRALNGVSAELGLGVVEGNVEIRVPDRAVVVDAIAKAPGKVVVIEIKASSSARVLQRASEQVRNALSVYQDYADEQGERVQLSPLVIGRASPEGRSSVRGVPVLQYDPGEGKFVNLDAVRERLANLWDAEHYEDEQ